MRTVRSVAAIGVVMCLSVLTLPVSPAHAEPAPVSLFGDSTTPAVANWDDEGSLELGVTFRSDVDGVVSAVRFYKGDKNTGTHTGSVWAADGDRLATATFSGETGSGWQTVTFDEPVEIEADATYVASYHTSVGFYSVTVNAFADEGISSGPLHVDARGAAFRIGAGFPDRQSPHNYFVDVVFRAKKAPEPSASASSPGASPTASASGTATATPPAAPGNGGGGGGSLPITGLNASLVAGAGLALAAVGVLLAWRHRRRTTRFVA